MSVSEVTPRDALTRTEADRWKEVYATEFHAIANTGTFKWMHKKATQLLSEGKVQVHKTHHQAK
jgi:hypothetical protein